MRIAGGAFLALAVVCGAGPAKADVLGIGRGIGTGLGVELDKSVDRAVDKIDPLIANTLDKTDALLVKHEDRVGTLIGDSLEKVSDKTKQRLDQVDGILEKRLLQVELGSDRLIDHALDKINRVARENVLHIDVMLARRINQIDGSLAKALTRVDGILDKQLDHVERTIVGAIDQTDQVLTARLEQLDEIAGRRLGNVDVIATKQRLGLERTITRAAWLIGLIVFVIAVLYSLWKEYVRREREVARAARGAERARRVLAILAGPLLRNAIVGGMAAAVLAFVPERLPMAAGKEQQALIAKHATALEQSLVALDWTRVRFHASQLEFLDWGDAPRYQTVEAKASLLRDVLEKPTAFATPAGRVATLAKIEAIERLLKGRQDPDVRTVRAMILWSNGMTKADELEAATLSARALWSAPRGFTLAPMARLMLEAYLHAPMAFTPSKPDQPATPSSDRPESIEGLQGALQLDVPLAPGSPFEGLVTLFHLMRQLDEASGAAYLDMIEAQTRVWRHAQNTKATKNTLADDKAARNKAAGEIIKAWEAFDLALMSKPALIASPSVLGIFRLNDALLTHALWYAMQPSTTEWPKALAAMDRTTPEDKGLLLAIAPARAVWARRYLGFWQGPARQLVELQEAQRFEYLEQQALLFEASYREIVPESGRDGTGARDEKQPFTPERMARHLEAAGAAAALGLHEKKGTTRVSLSEKLSDGLDGLREKVEKALSEKESAVDESLSEAGAGAREGLAKARGKASEDLRKKTKELLDRLRGNVKGRPATALI